MPDETDGRRQNLRINKNLVASEDGTNWPLALYELDYKRKRALIELPHEADSGPNRPVGSLLPRSAREAHS